jgi:hypothetical protein
MQLFDQSETSQADNQQHSWRYLCLPREQGLTLEALQHKKSVRMALMPTLKYKR